MPEPTLKDKRALVTGGASGIGAAAVRALAERGAHVVVADIDPVAAENIAREVGGESWAVDLTDTAALADLSLDVEILVNNAGIQKVAPIQDFDPADFHRILTLMLESPFLLIRAALPHMYERGWGRVINVSSIHGLRVSAFKICLRGRQAWPGGLVQDGGTGRGAARSDQQLRESQLRAYPVGRPPDQGSSGHTRDPGGAGHRKDHAH